MKLAYWSIFKYKYCLKLRKFIDLCLFGGIVMLFLILQAKMRDNMERLVMVPFSFGCVSESSVAVGKNNQTEKQKISEENLPQTRRKEVKESPSRGRMRSVRALLALPKSAMQRLIRWFKIFSQLFVYKEEVEEEEEIETEMEIGFPTDVKHVTHIGWDASTTINPIKGWENRKTPEIMSFPSISLKQFELAMAAKQPKLHQ